MFHELSSAPFNPRPHIPKSNPYLFCDTANKSTDPTCLSCGALTLPTWDEGVQGTIKWTTFSLHRDDPLEAKQSVFNAWDLAMEGTTSPDRIALFATNARLNIDLESKSRDKSKLDKALEPDDKAQKDIVTMLFQRLPEGVMKLCVQRGVCQPLIEDSNKEDGILHVQAIVGLE